MLAEKKLELIRRYKARAKAKLGHPAGSTKIPNAGAGTSTPRPPPPESANGRLRPNEAAGAQEAKRLEEALVELIELVEPYLVVESDPDERVQEVLGSCGGVVELLNEVRARYGGRGEER